MEIIEKREKWIFLLIIIQPLIDIATSISSYHGMTVTIGSLFRAILMAGLFIWMIRFIYLYKQEQVWAFFASYFAIILMLAITMLYKPQLNLFQEINFAIKTGYYLVMIHVSILLLKQRILSKATIYRAAAVTSLIVGVSYWLAIATGTGIDSYRYGSAGFSGWFFAANELSVIVIVLLGLSLVHLTYKRTYLSWFSLAFMISMVPMIGTKTAFVGGVALLLTGVGYILLFIRHVGREKSAILFLAIVILFICLIPKTPIFSATGQLGHGADHKTEQIESVSDQTETKSPTNILSSRDMYLQQTKTEFADATVARKLFGLGFAGDNQDVEKLIEMDFFDLFFGYGIIGSFLLVMPLIFLVSKLCKNMFPFTIRKLILACTLGLCLGIAALAGHVLFAPSVMTYVTIGMIALVRENIEVGKYDVP
ncbi:O-antigen ligase family protein [Lentibacillus daqui]|uniref:O-antigen ligase family protein n=1 Tax=Lentibacillus daqui TaxID=2911514 RepID=UPI0022B1C1A4|nr:O-antigen ligase family protein [Lentibacillus daqui]